MKKNSIVKGDNMNIFENLQLMKESKNSQYILDGEYVEPTYNLYESNAEDYHNENKIVELIFENKDDEEIIREYSVKKSSLSVASKRTKGKRKLDDSEKCC